MDGCRAEERSLVSSDIDYASSSVPELQLQHSSAGMKPSRPVPVPLKSQIHSIYRNTHFHTRTFQLPQSTSAALTPQHSPNPRHTHAPPPVRRGDGGGGGCRRGDSSPAYRLPPLPCAASSPSHCRALPSPRSAPCRVSPPPTTTRYLHLHHRR